MPKLSQDEQEKKLWDAIASKDIANVIKVFNDFPELNPNCTDKDGLTPLQYAAHANNYKLAKLLIDKKADVDYSKRDDRYTALMFAAIGGHYAIVRLLLENNADPSIRNCVNRNASEMACFVNQSGASMIITHWVPFSIMKPYIVKQISEDKARLDDAELAHTVHSLITFPSIHPIRIINFISENPKLLHQYRDVSYVLDNLTSRSVKPPISNEILSMKCFYLYSLLKESHECTESRMKNLNKTNEDTNNIDIEKEYKNALLTFIKKLITGKVERECSTPMMDKLIMKCIVPHPYPDLEAYRVFMFAATKLHAMGMGLLTVLSQTFQENINGGPSSCHVCTSLYRTNRSCSNCKSIYYCGKGCQKLDWFQHKKICKPSKS